jgi:transposase-like protein
VKRKTYSEEFKKAAVREKRAGIPTSQILSTRRIHSSMLLNWLKKYPDEPAEASEPGTALVVADKMNGHSHDHEKKKQVYALVAQGMKVKEAAKQAGVPVTTAYGWRTTDRRKNGGQLAPSKPHKVEPQPVSADGITALISAAEKALINLKHIRRSKVDNIHGNVPGADDFSDDFCHGQIAYNALARAFGMKK